MNKKEKDYMGCWIPCEILKSKDLTWMEKVLWSTIFSLSESRSKNFCHESNQFIANLMGTTEGTVAKTLTSIRKKGYIVDLDTSVDILSGHRRAIRVTKKGSS